MDPEDTAPFPLLSLGRSVWAIRREVLAHLPQAHRVATQPAWADVAARMAEAAPKVASRRSDTRAPGAVAVITLTGIITPRGSFLSMLFGGGFGGLQAFREEFREAVASPDVSAIVLDVDSPGGLYDLVPETAAEVYEARGEKPIVAVCNTMAASAAYYIASQADEVVTTPSGQAGSIGIYIVHEDWSGFNEQMGIDPTYISAGKYKTEGNPDEPLSEETREVWQSEMDDLYTGFVDAVARGRGVTATDVRSGYGEGRTLYADRALEAGLVDRIDTLEIVIGEFLESGGSRARASALRAESASRARDAAEMPETPSPEPDPAPEPAPGPDPVPEPDPVEPPVDPGEHPEPVQPLTPEPDSDPSEPDPEARAQIAAAFAD